MGDHTSKSLSQIFMRIPESGKTMFRSAGIVIVLSLLLVSCSKGQNLDVPYVSTPQSVVEKMLEVAEVGPGDYVIDLGCGDGRIVNSAAQRGAYGHGIDLDPERIREARSNARRSNVSDKVMFLQEDIFETDFSRANVITMYLLSSVNLKLRPRLLEELEPGTRIVSHDFNMGEWKPDKHFQVDNANINLGGWEIDNPIASDTHDIYYWIIPARVEGQWEWKTNDENFTMTVEQEFQEIDPDISTGNTSLHIEETLLKGERISITAANHSNGNKYVYNGRVAEDKIIGTVQIRTDSYHTIESWSAELR